MADEQGLGKSVTAIGLANALAAKSILVICPASLKLNWQREVRTWLVERRSIHVVDTKNDEWITRRPDVLIINYDIVHQFHDPLRARVWDLLIVDEAHYLKNPESRRSRYILGKKIRGPRLYDIEPIPARRKVFLTGTPIVNRPIELWPLVHALDPEHWPHYSDYVLRYCGAVVGGGAKTLQGATNLDELQEKLRATVMVRRLKKDVLSDLPPKMRQLIELPANGSSKAVRNEYRAYEKWQNLVEELQRTVEMSRASDNPSDYREAVDNLKQGVRVAFGEMAAARKEVALRKVPPVLERLADRSGRVVLLAHHKEVIRRYAQALGDTAVVLTGDTPVQERQEAVDRFQNDPTCEVFIGSIMAAGVGLTLTAASHVIFAELDWVPGNMAQAEDRCHRIGQQESVLVQHLVFEGSLDATMARTLVEKQRVIDQALDGKEPANNA